MNWVETLLKVRSTEDAVVIVTVSGTRGSTPRETGARMIVTETGTFGTIGGGQLEFDCIAVAAQWLTNRSHPTTSSRRFTLGANCGQCCGGVVDILFEQIEMQQAPWLDELDSMQHQPCVLMTATESHSGFKKRLLAMDHEDTTDTLMQTAIKLHDAGELPCRRSVEIDGNVQVPVFFEATRPDRFEIAIFGAGHVGSALVASLSAIECQTHWIDNRNAIFPDNVPDNTITYCVPEPQLLVEKLPQKTSCIVMTHSHALDLEICARILARDDIHFCGLIGSKAKKHQFTRRLSRLGLSEHQISKLVCPIGIAGIDGKKPAEIAIAVTAQLLQIKAGLEIPSSLPRLQTADTRR